MYGHINEIRAFVPFRAPMLALTATVTDSVRRSIMTSLGMTRECCVVSESPNKPNIFYSVKRCSLTIDTDFAPLVESLREGSVRTRRVIVYCRSLDTCADLYAYCHGCLKERSYYPPGSPHLSDYRLFGMYHSKTPQHNKDVILKSLTNKEGVVRVVFATMALGMGIDCVGLSETIHYGAPRSIDDYFQESGRAGRGGEPSTSTIYWRPSDVPRHKDLSDRKKVEVATVRRYGGSTKIYCMSNK